MRSPSARHSSVHRRSVALIWAASFSRAASSSSVIFTAGHHTRVGRTSPHLGTALEDPRRQRAPVIRGIDVSGATSVVSSGADAFEPG